MGVVRGEAPTTAGLNSPREHCGRESPCRRPVMLLLLLLLLLLLVVVVVSRRGRRVVQVREGGGVDEDGREAGVGRGGGGEEGVGVADGREERVGHGAPHRHVGRALRVLGALALLPQEAVLLLVQVGPRVLLHLLRGLRSAARRSSARRRRGVRHVRPGQRGRGKVHHRFPKRQRPRGGQGDRGEDGFGGREGSGRRWRGGHCWRGGRPPRGGGQSRRV